MNYKVSFGFKYGLLHSSEVSFGVVFIFQEINDKHLCSFRKNQTLNGWKKIKWSRFRFHQFFLLPRDAR